MRITHNWTEAVVESVKDLTPTVREICILPAGGTQLHAPGSHLQVQVLVNGKPQTRSYSLVGAPDGERYRVAVKRLDDGRGGSRAMWRLGSGDRLHVSDVQNHFPLDFDAPAYLLVAGGIGITPLVLMAEALAERGRRTGRTVRMLYGARTEDELAFLPELRACLGDALETRCAAPFDFAGEIARLPAGAQMYMCGPVPMLDAVRHAWETAGRPLADLRYETFGSSGRFAPQAFRVRVPRHGLDIMVPADCSLLDALEQAGVENVFDCRRGECGLCTVDVLALEGEIDHRDVFLSEHEKRENKRICACVSRVVGSVTLDSAYRPDA
ncbi:MAG: PDR/VanB family oxidoreductase [Pseudomonadota bacterium]